MSEKQLQRSTDLCIADDFQAIWMKDSTEGLIQFVKLVYLPGHSLKKNDVRNIILMCCEVLT